MRSTCNGEIYNFRALRAELEARGHRFRTGSDTEVIVHLYEERGDDCLDALQGMFAHRALGRARAHRLLLARDRLGRQAALLGARSSGGLLYASEPGAILASGLVAARPTRRASRSTSRSSTSPRRAPASRASASSRRASSSSSSDGAAAHRALLAARPRPRAATAADEERSSELDALLARRRERA